MSVSIFLYFSLSFSKSFFIVYLLSNKVYLLSNNFSVVKKFICVFY
ncbi:hypothetical protein BBU64B_F0031 (plasmid) [Borreliella burgdorferi 64b]|nr:hypothetical protein BBU64B_F0031 [Borreliella burgdorferi 64b]